MKVNFAARAERAARRASLVNLTFTDLLIVVLFVLLFYSFRATEEGRQEISLWEARLAEVVKERDQARRELVSAQDEARALRERVRELDELVNRLLAGRKTDTLSVEQQKAAIERLIRENEQLREEVARLRRQLEQLQKPAPVVETPAGRRSTGGTGLPRCPVTSSFLLNVKLLDNGVIVVAPAWEAERDAEVKGIPGVVEMATGAQLTTAEFRRLAERIAGWGLDQAIPCRFHVRAYAQMNSVPEYKRQQQLVDNYFYSKRY